MPSFKDHLPLAIIAISLSIAVFILFKELRSVKEQAAAANAAARAATSFQDQLQNQFRGGPQFVLEPPPPPSLPPAEEQATQPQGSDDVPAPPPAKLRSRPGKSSSSDACV